MFGPGNGIGTDYKGGKQVPELPPTLCRLDPRDGSLRVVADDFAGPNRLCFSGIPKKHSRWRGSLLQDVSE